MNDLHTKYRPHALDDIRGQDPVVRSVRAILKAKSQRAFIFAGPPGVGKTTLARVVGLTVGVTANNVTEVDGANLSSVEAMRELVAGLGYAGFGKNNQRLIIVDEVHALTKQAFQALLKSLEEPPEHIFWALCTTELSKVPPAIQTRCAVYELQPVHRDQIRGVLDGVCAAETFEVSPKVLSLVANEAGGSVRDALTKLAAVAHCKTREDAAKVLRASIEDTDIGHFMKGLKPGMPWRRAAELMSPLRANDAESMRRVVVDYFMKIAMNPNGREGDVQLALKVLGEFSTPYPVGAGFAPFVLSCANVVFA